MQKNTIAYSAIAGLFLALLFTSPSRSAPGDEVLLSGKEYMRAVSFDLRGKPPTTDDYDQLDADGEIPEVILDEWLDSEEFITRVVRYHRRHFWNNNSGIRLANPNWQIHDGGGIYYVRKQSDKYGRPDVCGDFPASFDFAGRAIQVPQSDGSLDEGWVMVAPYWDLQNPLKVCAMDAQENQFTTTGTQCNTEDSELDPECGCGPNLAWCHTGGLDQPVIAAIDEDLNLRVAELIRQDRSYLDLLTDSRAWVNGPLVHWLKNNSGIISYSPDISHLPYPEERLPDLEYTDTNTWVEVTLGPEQSGIFTSPSYLLRFMSNRARANRFFVQFLCQPFQTPPGGIPTGGNSIPTLNLSKRDGCKYCHALLEPSASTWGRWVKGGAGYLDPDEYPNYDPGCTGGGPNDDCRRHYIRPRSQEEYIYDGWMKAFSFLEERHHEMVDLGPRVLVDQGINDGRISKCVAQKAAEFQLNRELEDSEQEWLQGLATDFESGGWQFKDLMKTIITSSSYRRRP